MLALRGHGDFNRRAPPTGHPATEALVATLAGTEHDTGLDILKLESIAAYFREAQKYHVPLKRFQLKGYDSRILVAQSRAEC